MLTLATAVLALLAPDPTFLPDEPAPEPVHGPVAPEPTDISEHLAIIERPAPHDVTPGAQVEEPVRDTSEDLPTAAEAPPEPTSAEETEPESSAPSVQGSVWDQLAMCEASRNGVIEWDYGPHSGWGSGIHHGGLQFHPGTWSSFKSAHHPTYAYDATREQQIEVAERVLATQGYGAWPTCSRKLGLR